MLVLVTGFIYIHFAALFYMGSNYFKLKMLLEGVHIMDSVGVVFSGKYFDYLVKFTFDGLSCLACVSVG